MDQYIVQHGEVIRVFSREEQTEFARTQKVDFGHPDPQRVFTENVHTARG